MIITACTLDCPDACSLLAENGENGLRLRGNPDHPFTQGFVCPKLDVHRRRLASPHRLRSPRLKVGGRWQDIGWDEALGLCAEKIALYRDEPRSILHVRGSGNRGVVKALSNLFFRKLGASGLHGSLCDEAGIEACMKDFGCLRTNDVPDILNTSALINWGRDLARGSVHMAAMVRALRKKGVPVVTIAPGEDTAQGFTDHFVRVRPGTDRFLAAAVLREVLLRKGIAPEVAAGCHDPAGFEGLLAEAGPRLLEWCGARPEDVALLADHYAGPAPVATLLGWGLQRYRFGGQNVRFINALAMLSGQVGRSGGGAYFGLSSMANLALPWKAETAYGRTLLMPDLARELRRADPPVRMAWVECINPANQFPEAEEVARALDGLDFVVVADAFMTDTAEVADLILPVALMLEQEDIVGSFLHEYVQWSGKAVEPPEGVRTDYGILSELGARLFPPVILPEPEEALRQALDSPSLETSLEELRRTGYVRSTHPAVAFEDLRFGHEDGLYRLPPRLDPPVAAPQEYSLQLLTLINRRFVHSQIPPDDQDESPEVTVHPRTLERLGVTPGAGWLVTELGRLEVLFAADESMHPDCVVYRRGPWGKLGGGVNRIIGFVETDMGGAGAYYEQRCRLEQRDQ
ncbi:Anaerobic selenocysteine-containing dehydrogenase [Desulfomicrobium apsheronum]|uniref:Anaerobic selenocysteine-containing dehydrogenase n=1 Tax=Desulfomicrobium apsheronum TaxID=52560 RepID=A0A1I3TWK5_9BACT|nr:molybdopterin-dependent oxidoreductase [Desulfomicrobium apsheronum]SFJ74689.1 Anaerobic selenocysteine-containing dehydrogenase [Desulfomicrobium apsheronum]